jgi:hypothetical protein
LSLLGSLSRDRSGSGRVSAGSFNYDYSWLTDTFTPDRIKPFADGQFKNAFGVEPDSFRQA